MRTFALLLTLPFALSLMAQNAAPDWLEDSLYRGGKINVVIAVVSVILVGIGLWMFSMDRKLRKLEKDLRK